MSIKEKLLSIFKTPFSLREAYNSLPEEKEESIRARIYENLGKQFNRVAKGVYSIIEGNEKCVLIEGDGRDLSFLEDKSIDCILTDHPWDDQMSNKGGNRTFANYDCFQYSLEDFMEKARVLKDGSFLVEILPSENENNYKYLYNLKTMAEQCGLLYYSKVTWKKGTFVSNTGRKAKNTQDVMIFSKGKARNLRIDAKKSTIDNTVYMSGTSKMLPTMFDVQAVNPKNRIHKSEMPITLIEQILQFVTQEGEIVLDQFAGSGVVGEAALNIKRNCILVEKSKEYINNIKKRFQENLNFNTLWS